MIRHCDGTDPNLIRETETGYVPCDCGLTFDDVNHLVIFPRREFSKLRLIG